MKHLRLLVVLFAVLGLIAAACGSSDDGEASDTAAEDTTTTTADEETTTTVAEAEETTTTAAEETDVVRADADLVIWSDDNRKAVLEPFAEAFASDNGLTVAIQAINFDDLNDRFRAAAPAGEGPDILVGPNDWLGELVTSGLISPVELGAATSDFSEGGLNAFSFDGQLYGVPYALENVALFRNTDLVPEAPASFEELEEIALGLVASGDADVALGLQNGNDVYHNYPLFSAQDGYLFGTSAEGGYDVTDIGLDSAAGLAAAEQFGAWVDSGLISADVSEDIMKSSFSDGRAPFAITGPWNLELFTDAGVPFVVEAIPPVNGGQAAPFVGVQGFMLSAQSENPLFAQAFLTDVAASEEVQLAFFEAGNRPPANLAALEVASADVNIQGLGEAGAIGQPIPAIPEMNAVWGAWADAYTNILNGAQTPDEAFTAAAEQIRSDIG